MPSRLRKRPVVQPFEQLGDGFIEFRQREELAMPQRGQYPAFHHAERHSPLWLCPSACGPRRHDGDAVVLGHLVIGAVEIRLIAAGAVDAGARVIGHDQLRGRPGRNSKARTWQSIQFARSWPSAAWAKV